MKYKFFLVLIITFCLSAPAAFGQTFKRKPKAKTDAEKTEPTKQTKVTKSVEALPEEEQNTNPDRITTHELKRKLDAKADVLILDNRTGSAWLGSSVKIKGAVHMPLQELLNNIEKLPKDKEIITYCT